MIYLKEAIEMFKTKTEKCIHPIIRDCNCVVTSFYFLLQGKSDGLTGRQKRTLSQFVEKFMPSLRDTHPVIRFHLRIRRIWSSHQAASFSSFTEALENQPPLTYSDFMPRKQTDARGASSKCILWLVKCDAEKWIEIMEAGGFQLVSVEEKYAS